MKNNLVIKIFVLFSIIVLLASCRSGRPDMAKDMEGKGAVQDIEIFNVKKTAENFKETKNEFKDDVEEIRDLENIVKSDTRRVSLSPNENNNKTSLSIVDHNKFVKKLETQDISLKFNDMDIKSALKLFASLAQRNIIIGEEVTGNVTVDFENLNWGSAVYAILDINDLVMTVDDNSDLLRVHSKEVYVEMEKAKISRTLEVNKNVMTLEGGGSGDLDEEGNVNRLVVTEIFKVFHQESETVIEPIQAVLGADTLVEFINDPENNQLLVKGTPKELNYVENILDQIDIEKKQVLIEAYIINADDSFQESFNNNLIAVNANQIAAGKDGIAFTGISATPGTEFSFPSETITDTAAIGSGGIFEDATVSGGAVLIGNIGLTRLKAIINMSIEGKNTETISNPKLFAMDGETATLTQGDSLLKIIPASGDAAGSTVTVPQNLSITVTPEVIGAQKVKVELNLNNNKAGASAGEDVTTTVQSITSLVLLNNDEVAVLGGVYTNTKTDNNTRVPFFSKIPLFGTFFKNETKEDARTQMLIFLTASIV